MRRVHGPDYNLQCNECGNLFKNYTKLNIHMKRHRKDQYECDICKRKFSMRCYIVAHMQKHVLTARFKCNKCGNRFRSNPVYQRHSKICQGRDVRFANTNHQENSVKCVFCNRGYVTMTGLSVHYQKNHEASEYETICMECNRTCSDVGELATHKANAHPVLSCPICKQILRTKETLNIHISNHSQKDRPFSCEVFLYLTFLKYLFHLNYLFYRFVKQRSIGQHILKRTTGECTLNIAHSNVQTVMYALPNDMS